MQHAAPEIPFLPCPVQYTGDSTYAQQQDSSKYNSSEAINKYGWYPQVST
jgi:hypothetical protein